MSELLPCPWCKVIPKPHPSEDFRSHYYICVHLKGCYLFPQTGNYELIPMNMADAWNTRTPSDAWLPIESAKETDLGIFWLELRLPVAHYEWGPTQHYHFGRNLCWSSCYKATRWMPLPAPPQPQMLDQSTKENE